MWPCQTPCLWSCHVQENTWKYLPIMVVVAGFLGWHWYQERLLWDAAKFHYLGQLQKSNERFQRAVRACEAEAREEDLDLGKGEWNPEHISLHRGLPLDAGLPWLSNYQFYVVLRKREQSRPLPLGLILMCSYLVDQEKVWAVYEPEPDYDPSAW